MALTKESPIYNVYGIDETQQNSIRAFLQGAVYSWVKNRKDEWFAARDLVGGDNFEWGGTPLEILYQKHILAVKNSDSAIEAAGKDVGWLLKAVLSDDKRTFIPDKAGLVNCYRWIGNEP